jgi:hypothetical protein
VQVAHETGGRRREEPGRGPGLAARFAVATAVAAAVSLAATAALVAAHEPGARHRAGVWFAAEALGLLACTVVVLRWAPGRTAAVAAPLAGVAVPASRLVTDGHLRPYPWRICAEARGATLRFLAWPPSEPTRRWGDPTSGGQVTLPPGWDAPGRPGLFAGHLPAGRALGYRAVTTRAL